MVRQIVWDLDARNYLRNAIKYIREDSPKNADLVKTKIFESIRKIPANPYKHPADKFKQPADEHVRAYELLHFRISYQVTEAQIRILRIRHTSMEPLLF
ncbi:MAG TPA: type II toxin-antitoxin system RelE/ParE family toxin [Flavipsychrobacter sp.]|nr:type II toxin-antitoxin system RelE/ParE family toxin [Flavipsychrobacter sp.]